MAYTPQTWTDEPARTSPLSAARFDYIESGVQAAAAAADAAQVTASAAETPSGAQAKADAAEAAAKTYADGLVASAGGTATGARLTYASFTSSGSAQTQWHRGVASAVYGASWLNDYQVIVPTGQDGLLLLLGEVTFSVSGNTGFWALRAGIWDGSSFGTTFTENVKVIDSSKWSGPVIVPVSTVIPAVAGAAYALGARHGLESTDITVTAGTFTAVRLGSLPA